MKGIRPHMWVEDVEGTARFYLDAAGFDLTYRQPTEGEWNFCILNLGEAELMLAAFPSIPGAAADLLDPAALPSRRGRKAPCCLYCEVDDVDIHHDRAARAGARIIEPPDNRPWGLRQYTLEDPNGQLWTFFSPTVIED